MSIEKSIVDAEEWRDIDGAVGYQVSNLGRIRSSWSRGGSNPEQPTPTKPWRVIKGSTHKLGYKMFDLTKGGAREYLHRIVAKTFHGFPPSPDSEVRHLDGNPRNNRADNLQWGTHQENALDMIPHGKVLFGEKSKRATITNEQAREIVARHCAGENMAQLALAFKVSHVTVWRIVHGKKWSTITGVASATKKSFQNPGPSLTMNGVTMTSIEWGKKIGIAPAILRARVQKLGWSDEKALTEPIRKTVRTAVDDTHKPIPVLL